MKKYDLDSEEITPTYFDHDALRIPPYRLYRLDGGGSRYYYSYDLHDANESLVIVPSVTEVLKKTLPTSEGLIRWRIDKGAEADRYVEERAHQGTFMHINFAELLIERYTNLDETYDRIIAYFKEHALMYDARIWAQDIRKDLLAFAQWIIDYDVTPLAIEVPLYSLPYKVAGTVDLICDLTLEQKGFWGEVYKSGPRKGQPKETKQTVRRKAIVDYKSKMISENGSAPSYIQNELQLLFYEQLVKTNFSEFANEDLLLFNWFPSDWQAGPGYKFLDQTRKHSLRKLELLSELYFMDNNPSQKTQLYTFGEIDLSTAEINLAHNFEVKTYAEVIA